MRDTDFNPNAGLYDVNRELAIKAGEGDLEGVKALEVRGGDPSAYNCYALRLAADAGHLDVVMHLVEEKGADVTAEGNSPFWWAAQNGFIEVVDYLFDLIPDKQKPNINIGMIRAAGEGFPELVGWYHKRGANLKANNNEALRQATIHSRHEVVQYLVKNGVSLDVMGPIIAEEWRWRLETLKRIELESEEEYHAGLRDRLRKRKPQRLGH